MHSAQCTAQCTDTTLHTHVFWIDHHHGHPFDHILSILAPVSLTADTQERITFFQKTIKSLQKLTTRGRESPITSAEVISAAADLKKLCEQPDLLEGFIAQVKTSCPDIVKNIPDFEKALRALSHIPLSRFSHPREVLTFVNALIESGIASQSEQGLVFVLGNTSTGKTSLVNTFKDFVAHPSEKPSSVLTKPDDGLIETQVLEVYDGLSLKQEKAFQAELGSLSSAPVLVNLKKIQKTVTKDTAGLQLKIVDLGKGRSQKKTELCGNFPQKGGWGSPQFQFTRPSGKIPT